MLLFSDIFLVLTLSNYTKVCFTPPLDRSLSKRMAHFLTDYYELNNTHYFHGNICIHS